MLVNVTCAAFAGGISSAIANPTDVLKVRMQAQGKTNTMPLLKCFVEIYKTEGMRGKLVHFQVVFNDVKCKNKFGTLRPLPRNNSHISTSNLHRSSRTARLRFQQELFPAISWRSTSQSFHFFVFRFITRCYCKYAD